MLKAVYKIEIILNSGDVTVEEFTVDHDVKLYMFDDMEQIDDQIFALKIEDIKKIYGDNVVIGDCSVNRRLVEATEEDCLRVGGMVCGACEGFGIRKVSAFNEYKACDNCNGVGIIKGMAN